MWWRLALALAYAGSPLVGFRAPLERRSAPRASEVAEDHRLHRARAVVEALRREGPPEQASSELEQRASSGQHDAGSVRATHLDQAVVDYDPEGSARRFAKQPMRVLRRQLELALPLAAFALSVLMDVALGVERANRPARAAELLALISRCGPAVIKAGQALASRSDLLPAEYLAELQRLQDDVPPFPSDVAFEVLRQELGVPPSELFASISAEPIAAASLGQVYKAVRKSTGEPLAIKIQRPGSLEVAELDLHILRGCAQLLNALIRAFERDVDVVGVIDDFGTLLLGELDYRKEAANAQRFVALYARARDKVGAPAVFPELTTRRVLVEGWVEGVRLTDRAALAAHGLSSQQLVQSLVRCSLRQMLEDGFFHADPHAGNLLVTPDGTLTYIDFGMVSYVTTEQRLGLVEAIVHLVNRDFDALANLYKQLGFIPRDQPTEPIARALNDALPDALDAPVSELNLKNVFGRLGNVMFEFPFALPPFYTAVIRCLGVLEGVALQADARFPVIRAAYPFVAAKLLTDPSPRLQAALLDLLRKRDGRSGSAHLVQLVSLLDHALGETDPLALTERLAQLYLRPEHAPLVRELMAQAVDMLDYLGSKAPELADASAGGLGGLGGLGGSGGSTQSPPPGAAGLEAPAEAKARAAADGELRRTAEAVQNAIHGMRQVVGELASGSPVAQLRARRLAMALLAEPMGQQFVLEFGLMLSERATVRSVGALLQWPEEQMPGAHFRADLEKEALRRRRKAEAHAAGTAEADGEAGT